MQSEPVSHTKWLCGVIVMLAIYGVGVWYPMQKDIDRLYASILDVREGRDNMILTTRRNANRMSEYTRDIEIFRIHLNHYKNQMLRAGESDKFSSVLNQLLNQFEVGSPEVHI